MDNLVDYLKESYDVNGFLCCLDGHSFFSYWLLTEACHWLRTWGRSDAGIKSLLEMKSQDPDLYYVFLVMVAMDVSPSEFRMLAEKLVRQLQDKGANDKYDAGVKAVLKFKSQNPKRCADFLLSLAKKETFPNAYKSFCQNLLEGPLNEEGNNKCEDQIKCIKKYRWKYPDKYYYHLLYLFAVTMTPERHKRIAQILTIVEYRKRESDLGNSYWNIFKILYYFFEVLVKRFITIR
ncbi:hypothetical protein HNY73_015773 [Argiope bruennichi]|uniref:Uncharacterized protein n=1 Tax=Argiope bruennichi TaxID=94029 RepID=A0A8T0ELJ2_ARGBR|nr:hypothetical protein HNY73_015773 [Argiope bruennichi]